MLQLTQKQVSLFSQKLEQEFVEKIKAYYKQQLVEHNVTIEDKQLSQEINTLIIKAKDYGYKTQKEIFLFIEIIMLIGGEQPQDSRFEWVYDNFKQNSDESTVDIQQVYDALINQKFKEQ